MQEEVKPRIKRYARSRWECRGDDWIGFGETPKAAYDWWSVGASMGFSAKSVTQQSKQPPTYGKAEGFTQQSNS